MKRQVILLMVVLITALVMASGAAFAGEQATAKLLNTIQCPNQPNNETCIGTKGGDLLVGGEEFERIEGRGGNDTYDGKGGGDDLFDGSKKSNDRYVIPETEFSTFAHGGINITDRGGSSDVLDLSVYRSTSFTLTRADFDSGGNELTMQGPGARSIGINGFFTKNTIDSFKFSDTTLTAKQMKERIQRQ